MLAGTNRSLLLPVRLRRNPMGLLARWRADTQMLLHYLHIGCRSYLK